MRTHSVSWGESNHSNITRLSTTTLSLGKCSYVGLLSTKRFYIRLQQDLQSFSKPKAKGITLFWAGELNSDLHFAVVQSWCSLLITYFSWCLKCVISNKTQWRNFVKAVFWPMKELALQNHMIYTSGSIIKDGTSSYKSDHQAQYIGHINITLFYRIIWYIPVAL